MKSLMGLNSMDFVQEAYRELYPNQELTRMTALTYSGKFSDYNARVYLTPLKLEFRLSKSWRGISREIQIGLLQHLLAKLFKTKIRTNNMDLYEYFLKNVHLAVPKTESDPTLDASFQRLNEKYFSGLIDKPNLVWGLPSKRKLGSYEYARDTIVMSSIFKDAPQEFLDSVMYHEMLHKKHKFKESNGRCRHHTAAFRAEERQFENFDDVERRMKYFLAKKKFKSWLGF